MPAGFPGLPCNSPARPLFLVKQEPSRKVGTGAAEIPWRISRYQSKLLAPQFMEGSILVGGAQAQDGLGALISPIAHACLLAAGAHQRLALRLHLTTPNRESQGAVARIVHVALVVFQVGRQFSQGFPFARRTQRRMVPTHLAQSAADATVP